MGDIKSKLLAEIEKIDDSLILQQLPELISQSDQGSIAIFNENQKIEIKKSQDQIENDDFFDHDDLMNMI